jgi:hypothetical protein
MWWMLSITCKYNPLAQTYWKVSQCWEITRFSIAISITYLNKTACCPHAWTHIEGSLKLITIIKSRRMEVGSLGSWPNSRKYGEKDVNETCQLSLYPMANQGNCKAPTLNATFLKAIFPQTLLHHLHHLFSQPILPYDDLMM